MEAYLWETAEEMDKKLAERVRTIRKRRSISQEKLSKQSGVSYGSIKRFETCRLYDDQTNQWRLSPAYDLTYSTTYYGEHTTTVDDNRRISEKKELTAVGSEAGLPKKKCKKIIDEIYLCVNEMLKKYILA